jgi:hypothetical protein
LDFLRKEIIYSLLQILKLHITGFIGSQCTFVQISIVGKLCI